MGDVKVCRMCLNMGVKLYDLQSEPLETYYASIKMESEPLYTTNLPPYACFECAALLKKYYLFRKKCFWSQTLLCGFLDETGKLTPEQIKASERQNLLEVSEQVNISLQEEKNSPNRPEYITPTSTKEVGIKQENDDEDSNSIDLELSSDDDYERVKKSHEDKIEIHIKMDKEMERVELGPQQDTCNNSPSKKPQVYKLKEQGKTKTVRRPVIKKKLQKIAKKDKVCDDDAKDMEDITIVTLTLTPEQIKASERQNLLDVSEQVNISLQEEKNSPNRPEYITPTSTKEVGIKQENDDEDSNSIDLELSSDDDYERVKKSHEDKIEIHIKMDKEMERVELGPQQDTCNNSPSKKPQVYNLKEQGKTKTVRRPVIKKKLQKVAKKDKVCDDDAKDMEDITIVTLTKEEQLEEMDKRKQSSNYLNCPYKCHLCYKGFVNSHTWQHHITKHSTILGDLECEICKYRFNTKRGLLRHMLHHSKRYVCKLCPYYSTNITTLKQHQGSHKGITHICKFCHEVFTVKTTYMIHMRIKHPSEYICGYCGYSFVSKQGLLVHRNMMHKDIVNSNENEEGPYCIKCDVKFISTDAYKRHLVMSTKHTSSVDSINGCRACGATFSDAEELRLHQRKEHPKTQLPHYRRKAKNRWPAKCKHCTEVLTSAREFREHYRLAHPDENFPLQKKCVCDICGKRFMCNAILEMHKRTHSGDRPYKCSLCDKACYTPVNLRLHQQKHSDVRPFPCTVCPRAFKRKQVMERHLQVHSSDNPYKCEICGVGFNKACTRTLHVRTTHTGEPAPPKNRRSKTHD